MNGIITKSAIVSGVIAGSLWSSWAFYVHRDFEFNTAIKAAGTQFFGSFILGTMMTLIMDRIFHDIKWNEKLKIALSIFLPFLSALGLMIFIHFLNGTPNILKTVSPSQPISLGWSILYTMRLYKISLFWRNQKIIETKTKTN